MINFTVGPVMSEKEVLEIGSESSPYFRTDEFSQLMLENERLMNEFLYAPEKCHCVFLTSSGTGAMESCVMNLLNDSERVLVINGGSFGQRFVDLCRLHKRNYTEIPIEFGHQITREQLEQYRNLGYTALLVNMDETSSGTLYDMKLVSEFCKENNIFLIVDAISAFISDELDMTKLKAGAIITGSQKALAVHPGVSIIALSEEAQVRVKKNTEQCLYLSLKEALKNMSRGQTPFTPAVTTLIEINTRLKLIKQRGFKLEQDNIQKRATDFRKFIKDYPFTLVSESPAFCVTALHPINDSAKKIIEIMKNKYHIWLCPNGGEKADSVFRVGHIGNITKKDSSALEEAFIDLYKNY
jgi:aspartate aminotransferase-like enzyme